MLEGGRPGGAKVTVQDYGPAHFHLYIPPWMTACTNDWRVGQCGPWRPCMAQENGEGRW